MGKGEKQEGLKFQSLRLEWSLEIIRHTFQTCASPMSLAAALTGSAGSMFFGFSDFGKKIGQW